MHRSHVVLSWCALVITFCMIFNTTIAFAIEPKDDDVDISETVPVDTTTGTEGEDVFDVLAGKDTMQDIAAYLNYKRLTVADIDAIKWSFVISQMAKPFEEDLTDLLSNETILKIKEQNLSISTTPDIIDSDYVYLPIAEGYSIDSVNFTTVWETISKNIRYNSLVNEDLEHYTVKMFFTGGVSGKQGFISDYVYTDKEGKYSQEISKSELKNNIGELYGLDNEEHSTKISEYLRNPSMSLTKDPNEGVRGQRRLVPVFVGSEISSMYLQIGMMIYCKENTGDSMTFKKFINTFGSEKMYVDSFGNITFYDSKESSYKIVLPNACNTVLTSEVSQIYIDLYGSAGKHIIDTEIINQANNKRSDKLIPIADKELIQQPEGFDATIGLYQKVPGWSESTYIYNKLLGSVYSTRRRLSDEVEDETIYKTTEEDLAIAHYSSYIAPNIANRTDFRNSFVFAKPDFMYLSPNLFGKSSISNAGSSIQKWFQSNIDFTTTSENTSYKYVPQYSGFVPYSLDSGTKIGEYLGLDEIMFNSMIPNGTTQKNNKQGDSIGTYVSVKHAFIQNSFMGILQVANDATMMDSRNRTIKDADNSKSDGAIAFPLHQAQLVDVEESSILGEYGGFLEEYKRIYNIIKEKLTLTGPEYDSLTPEEQSDWTLVEGTDALGNYLTRYVKDVEYTKDNYSTTYYLKRDNRISNRYSMFPLDDMVTLSYVWLQEYIPRMGISNYDKDESIYNSTQQFLSTAASSGSNSEIVSLAFNTDIEDTKKFTWCDYSMQDTTKTEAVYTTLKLGEAVDVNPFARTTEVSTRAIIMGLYRNTDSVVNPDSPLKFSLKEKKIDVEELLKKINFGIDNPLTKISNAISGLGQQIHNAIAVGVNSNILVSILDTNAYAKTVYWYVILGTCLIMFYIIIKLIMTAINRDRFINTLTETLSLCLLITVVPLMFTAIINLNSMCFKSIMQNTNDKATLVAIQKTVEGFINKDVTAEQRYMAYRQQFSSVEDIYQDSDVQLFDSIVEGKPTYKSKGIDELVNEISMKLNQEVIDESGTRQWYTQNSFTEVQKKNYSTDFSKYFYDYMMYHYLRYYARVDLASTSFGAVASQMNTEDKDIALRLDKVLHNLKGGFSRVILDEVFLEDIDITGITTFMNSYVVSDNSELPYLRVYTNVLETSMRKKYSMRNTLSEGNLILPYGSHNLQAKEPWRTEYFKNYETYLKYKPVQQQSNITKVDEAIDKAYTNTMKRAQALAKYRTGQFSDTSLIYTTSLIAAQELAKALGDVEYGIQDVADLDKLMRVIYSTTTEDIYNQEALMYTIQDRIDGGIFLTIMIILYEICYILVTFLNIIICAFSAFAVPICLWLIWKRKINNGTIHCFVGMLTQITGQLLSLYILLLPLALLSIIANKPLTAMGYWVATLMLLLIGIVGTIMSITLFSIFLKDMKTMGGSVIVATMSSAVNRMQNSTMHSDMSSMETTAMNISNAEINAVESQANIETDSIEVTADQATLDGDGNVSQPMYEYMEDETDPAHTISKN